MRVKTKRKVISFIVKLIILIISASLIMISIMPIKSVNATQDESFKQIILANNLTRSVKVIDNLESDLQEVKEEVESIKEIEMPMKLNDNNSEKNWMDYKSITSTTSKQYKLIYESGNVTICDDGLLRNENDYIGVALGSKYGDIGDEFRIYFDNGNYVDVFKVDEKSDRHTVYGEYNPWNNSYVEMVIDSKKAFDNYKGVYTGDFNDDDVMHGDIVGISKLIGGK